MLVKSGNWSTVPWSNIRVYVRFLKTRTTGFLCVCGGGGGGLLSKEHPKAQQGGRFLLLLLEKPVLNFCYSI